MTMVIPTMMYIILVFSLMILMYMEEVSVSAEMYDAAVARFQSSPWQLSPAKTINQVRGGAQAYSWLEKVFVNQLYTEAAEDRRANSSLMVGSFNRALKGRLTLKRRKLDRPTDALYANSVARSMSYQKTNAWAYRPSQELTTDFGSSMKFKYEEGKGFNNAGGYVQMLDFDLSRHDLMQQVSNLKDNFWFDLSQGSLAVELLYYNGNVNQFLYVVFIFEHDFSGQTDVTVKVSPLSMGIHDPVFFGAWVRYVLYLVILTEVIVFVKNELEDMTADYTGYFSQPMGYLNVCSFAVLAYTMGLFFSMVLEFTFLNFRLPMDADPEKQIEQFQAIAHLAGTNATFNVALGVGTCLVVFQSVSLMTSLLSQWRLVSDSLSSMAKHLVAFLAIFFIMLTGFGQAGHFFLGLKMDAYRSTSRSILTVMEMVKGKANYPEIVRAGGFYGDVYWFGLEFYFLIFQQFLTALISVGYFKQRAIQSDNEAQPLQRFVKSVKVAVQKYSGYARRIISPITSLLKFGRSGGPPREDFDMIARLQDKRATKPVVRTVRYELRLGEKDTDVEDPISTDVKLRAQDPFYPDGMMHYYVEETVLGGPARDFKVQKGFRLVGIKKDGLWDHKRFRDPKWFQDPNENKGNPQRVLEGLNMPVQLEFQGRVRLFSLECIALLFFCGVFLAFSLQVARVSDVYGVVSLQKASIQRSQWLDSKLSRVMSFQQLSLKDMGSFNSWMTGIFFDKQMSCSTLPGGTDCRKSNGARSNWSLWVSNPNPEELNVSDLSNSAGLRLFQGSRPPSAVGMSLGFVPDGPRRFNTTDVYPSPVETSLSKNQGKNLGVMRNNYARITFQLACFHPNKNERFKEGYQYVMDDVVRTFGSCSSAPCMREMIKRKSECYNSRGYKQDKRTVNASSGLLYEYSETGTYLEQGGIVIGLGMNLEEAQTVWNLVSRDLLPAVVSFTMEYVDYNGNLDMFAWTKVAMDIMETGKIGRSVETVVYPLNVFSMGYQPYAISKMTANFALFLCYILATILFAGLLVRDLLVQLSLTSLSKPFYMFFSDFIQDDVCNALDVVTVILNVYILQDVLTYILLNGGLDIRKGFNSWTLDYGFSDSVTPDFVDPFKEFSKIAEIQATFKVVVALNGLVLSIRVLKYFRSLTSLRLVLSSVVAAMGEFLTLMLMIIVVLVAFVFMMYLRFGVQVPRYESVFHTTNELFFFLVGSLETQDLWEIDSGFFFVVFMAYQVAFLLILNIFTAAITFRWKDARRDAEDFTITGAFRTLFDSLKFLRSTKHSAGAGDEKTMHKLDEAYWQDRSVLRHVRNLNSNGKITFGGGLHAAHQDSEEVKDGGEEDELAELGMDKEHHGPFDFRDPEHRRMFLQTFRKAHMEIASQKCLELEDRDTGAGVDFEGTFEDTEQDTKKTLEQKLDDEEDAETMGIVEEDSQLHKAGTEITTHMDKKLHEHPRPAGEMSTAEEIWLDALVTVLEEAGALRQLQKLFLPIPMIIPKKTQEWGIFNQKKQRMEKRLNRFFGLLQEEARLKHYEYLKDMAVSKERVLKQQSLVLTDFLESLDDKIKRLQEEIKELSRQNASIQSHVSPLL